ncbi:hypothetical protein SLS56_003550 [Neofusicoccum ribis]|uniref:Enoyl reductase (ER) domain-containing protein n=1 Tax=Neofusicoccum ribis TaxID=45134 RepID=A0ABR3SYQ0_9PEZI
MGDLPTATGPIPTTTQRWVIDAFTGPDGLRLEIAAPLPALGPHDVLVKLSAASLNYRDLVMARGQYPWALAAPIIPCSDGAGTVLAVGPAVAAFRVGDQVATVMNGDHTFGPVQPRHLEKVLGGSMQGTLAQHGVFPERYLIALPKGLSMLEGATLPCAALTAWDALYGLEGRGVKAGQWVVTQGTGGLAKAAGAKVIATTSSEEKAKRLRELGADHVINYTDVPEWGKVAKELTPNQEGVDLVVDVAGHRTVKQSLEAVKWGGIVSLVGFRGGAVKDGEDEPKLLDMFFHFCIVRTSFVGPRTQYEDMNRVIEACSIKPAIDDRVFDFEEAKEAFRHMETQQHFGKVCVRIA